MSNYCAFCDTADVENEIVETKTPICDHCAEIYNMGKENQGTIDLIDSDNASGSDNETAQKYPIINGHLGGSTCLQGYIDISYKDLVEKLGEPSENYDDYKSDAEWQLEFEDGTVATLYNYKDGRNYLGAEGLDKEEIRDWHIGGNDTRAVEKVHELLGGKHTTRNLR